jgi:hypothetical protein
MVFTSYIFAENIPVPLVPSSIKGYVYYYNNFDNSSGKAEINKWNIKEEINPFLITNNGLIGKGFLSNSKNGIVLKSSALSPDEPITISVWWKLKNPYKTSESKSFGFGIFSFIGKGYISCFIRSGGKGGWCGLKEPAGVFQVQNFKRINDINGIYNTDAVKLLNLKRLQWHNTIITFSNGMYIRLYQDGKKVGEWGLNSPFNKNDGIKTLQFGFSDEVLSQIVIFNKNISSEEVEEYYNMMKGLKETLSFGN